MNMIWKVIPLLREYIGRKNANYFGCQTFVNNNTNSRSYCCPGIAFKTWLKKREKNKSCISSELVSLLIHHFTVAATSLFRLQTVRANGVSTKPDVWEVSGLCTGSYTWPRPASKQNDVLRPYDPHEPRLGTHFVASPSLPLFFGFGCLWLVVQWRLKNIPLLSLWEALFSLGDKTSLGSGFLRVPLTLPVNVELNFHLVI